MTADIVAALKDLEHTWMTDGYWNRLADAMIAAAKGASA